MPTTPTHCPRCRKAYQARNVNAADHRVDYRDADGSTAHLCGQCWRDPQPLGAAAAPADGLTRQPGADPK